MPSVPSLQATCKAVPLFDILTMSIGRKPLEHAMMKYRTFLTYILLKYGGQTSGEHLDTFPWSHPLISYYVWIYDTGP
jgi:hypothetical protein